MDWQSLEPGLELAEVVLEAPAVVGDRRVRIVRVDPARFTVEIGGGAPRAVGTHLVDHGWVASINAGMFEPDRSPTFLLRAPGGLGGPGRRTDGGAFLVVDGGEAHLLDRACDDTPRALADAETVVQGFRVWTCRGATPWKVDARVWSHAMFGVDRSGRLLLVHARTPWNTAIFAEQLAALPLDLRSLMYLEGGPEATLALDAGPVDAEWVGSYETGFLEDDSNTRAWPIPYVIGIARR